MTHKFTLPPLVPTPGLPPPSRLRGDLSAAPQLVMLANVALTGDIGCYDCQEDRLMAELKTVDDTLSDNGEELGADLPDVLQSERRNTENQAMPRNENKDESLTVSQNICDSNINSSEVVTPECSVDKGKKSKPFRCRPCQYEAESEEQFVHHIKVHSAKKFIVEENAEKKNKSKVVTVDSEEIDISKGPIRCDRCGYNTNRYDHYLAHLKHHEKVGDNERVYKCTICTYTTVSEYHWKKHLRNHFPRKVYTCSQCSYFSDRKNNYVQHMRTHTGERPYQCPQCPYSSSQKTHLTRHMRTHSGEKPFKCDQCNYVASNQHEVTRHARQVHNGPKPLTCPHCEYRTADRSNFKKHVELHVNPRQFLCPVCKYAASKKCNLQYHIKSKHPHSSDITMDVSKVKLRTKRLENDIPCAKVSKKMSEKQPLKVSETLADKITTKVEKNTPASKEKSLKSWRMKTRNYVLNGKVLKRKRENDVEKLVKFKSGKRRRCSTVMASSSLLEPANETRTKIKRKKIQKAKELADPEKQRGKIELKPSNNKYLKTKQKKKKDKKNKKIKDTIVLSAGCSSNEDTKCNHAEEQPTVDLQRKEECSRKSSRRVPSEDVGRSQNLTSEAFTNAVIGESQVEAVEQNENPLVLRSPETSFAVPIVPIGMGETQRSSDQVMSSESEEQTTHKVANKLEKLPCVGKTAKTCIEQQTEVPDGSLEKAECPISLAICEDLKYSDAVEVDGEIGVASVVEQARSSQVSDTELISEPSRSKSPNNFQDDKGKDEDNKKQEKDQAKNDKDQGKEDTMEIDEDEGIHSHDGSDISDDVSEGSDDSGLNGAKSTAGDKIRKRTLDEGVINAPESFVCIFCDRVFSEKGDYTKHLNRHLVNVYYLEEAAKSQE
uniref:RE1 silencing transcription factor n=1 Tax=Callorhinchus milii TaxID=7868 RepID=A0A4W3HJV1_CALMI